MEAITMGTVVQVMMGIGLAACCGLRAWMPLLIAGLLARSGYVPVSPAFAFLTRTDALIVFSVATVLELIGDKVIVIDHILDAIGTFVRPAAGTVLASAMVTRMDPVAATTLGLIAGGGTAFTMHAGKAVLRTKCSVLAHFHGGTGNAALSTLEDVVALCGVFLAAYFPVIAFLITLPILILMIWMIRSFVRKGAKLWAFLTNRREQKQPSVA